MKDDEEEEQDEDEEKEGEGRRREWVSWNNGHSAELWAEFFSAYYSFLAALFFDSSSSLPQFGYSSRKCLPSAFRILKTRRQMNRSLELNL